MLVASSRTSSSPASPDPFVYVLVGEKVGAIDVLTSGSVFKAIGDAVWSTLGKTEGCKLELTVGILLGAAVRSKVGSTVGGMVGVVVGARVGGTEGVLVGAVDGVAVGLADGVLVGTQDGDEFGILVSAAEGRTVGEMVEAVVGTDDGRMVGVTEGKVDGEAEGFALGKVVRPILGTRTVGPTVGMLVDTEGSMVVEYGVGNTECARVGGTVRYGVGYREGESEGRSKLLWEGMGAGAAVGVGESNEFSASSCQLAQRSKE